MKVRNGMTRKFMVPVLGVLLAALPAWAQQDGGQEERATTLEEVIVTAQKREERLQDTPISAVTFSDEDLQALGANELAVAVNYAPNVIVRKQTNSNANYAIGMRGVTSGETALAVDPVVGMYVDGIYLGRMTGAALDIGDMERMEVLRGPQGSLYGRNVIGGAINMVSRKPGEEFEFSQHVGLGERGYKRSQTIFNSPVFGRGTSLRVNYMRDERDGILQNRAYANTSGDLLGQGYTSLGDDLGEQLSEAWRLSLRLNPQPGMRVNYAYEKNDRFAIPTASQLKNVNVLAVDGNFYLGALPQGVQDETRLLSAAEVVARAGIGDDAGLTDQEKAQRNLLAAGAGGTHFFKGFPYAGVVGVSVDANGNPVALREGEAPAGYAPIPEHSALVYPIFNQASVLAEPDDRLGYAPLYYGGEETSDTDGHLLSIEWDVLENAVFKVLTSYRSWDSAIRGHNGEIVASDFGSFQVGRADLGRVINVGVRGGGVAQPDIKSDPDDDIINLVAEGTNLVRAGEWVSLFRAGRSSDQQQFTQEIQLLGESADKRFKYALGLYYFEEQANESNPQFAAYPGSALPTSGGVTHALDFDTRVADAAGPSFQGILLQQAPALAPIVNVLTTEQLRVLLLSKDLATDDTSGITTALTQPVIEAIRTPLLQGVEAGFPARARAQHFQDLGSGSLCGDPDGETYGITDLSLIFDEDADPGSITVANACLGKTILGGSPVFIYGTDNKAVAAYAQGALDLSDRVNLAVGLRYTIDERSAYLQYSQINLQESGEGSNEFGTVEDTVRASEEWDKGTYDITLNYRWLDDFSTYAKLATGYRAGGYNARAASRATFQDPVNAEELINYEFGWKFEGLGRTLRVNGALFKTDYEENQTSQFSPSLAGATSIITNAGDRKLEGAELEITWVPLAGLTWNLNLGYTDAYWDYYPDRGIDGNPHDPDAVVPYAPEVSYSTILEYELPPLFNMDIGNWAVRLEAQYQDEFTISPTTPLDHIGAAPDRTIVNLRLTLSDVRLNDGGRMSFSLWGKNITDEEYQEFPIPFGVFNIATFGEPSSAGIDFRYEY